MSKGSGSTRGGNSSSPRGTNASVASSVRVENTTWLGQFPAIKATYDDMQITASRTPEGRYLIEEQYSEKGEWEMAPDRTFTRDELRKHAIKLFTKWKDRR